MKVGILGVGLIGGSIAQSLHRSGIDLFLDDANPDVGVTLMREGLGDVAPWPNWIDQVDKLVLGVPIEVMAAVMAEVTPRMAPHATLVEVSSLKEPIATSLKQAAQHVNILSMHLMAGREISGYHAATAELFDDCRVAVVDVGLGMPDFAEVRWWREHLRFGNVSVWDMHEHDAAVAWVSQLPYLVSRTCREAVERHNPGALGLVGPGYRDTCRVGLSAWEPMAPLFKHNSGELESALKIFEEQIHQWRITLKENTSIT